MFTSTSLRLNYPRTKTRHDERTLEYHGINHFHIDDDPNAYREYDATLEYKDGGYVVYGKGTPTRSYKSLDACLHYILGGVFSSWKDHWSIAKLEGN
jgi:hypothetical protein